MHAPFAPEFCVRLNQADTGSSCTATSSPSKALRGQDRRGSFGYKCTHAHEACEWQKERGN